MTPVTVNVGLAPYNVSASASATTNGTGIRKAIADVAAAGGGTVVLPRGTIVVNHCPSNASCLPLASNVTIAGQGRTATTIKVADGENGSSVAVFGQALGTALTNVHLAHFGIDGNRAHRAVDAQKPAIRVGGADRPVSNLLIEDMLVQNNPGDAFQDMGNSTHVRVENVVFKNNGRNGITLDPVTNTVITDTAVTGASLEGDQNAFDVEPDNATGSVDGLVLDGCTLKITQPQLRNYTLAMGSGYYNGNAGFTRNVVVRNCSIFGATSLVGVQNARLGGNSISNVSEKYAAISIRYQNDNVSIENNTIDHKAFRSTAIDNAGVLIQFSGGFQPRHVAVVHNNITLHSPLQKGVAIAGAVYSSVNFNVIGWDQSAQAGTQGQGILINPTSVMTTVRIGDNRITDPRGVGIRVTSSQATITQGLLIARNLIVDDRGVHTLTAGIKVDTTGPPSGTGALGAGAVYRNGPDNVVVMR